MEFCSECGTVLFPKRKGDEICLACPICGYYRNIERAEDYKLIQIRERRNPHVPILEYGEVRRREQPDYDIDTDEFSDYYEDNY